MKHMIVILFLNLYLILNMAIAKPNYFVFHGTLTLEKLEGYMKSEFEHIIYGFLNREYICFTSYEKFCVNNSILETINEINNKGRRINEAIFIIHNHCEDILNLGNFKNIYTRRFIAQSMLIKEKNKELIGKQFFSKTDMELYKKLKDLGFRGIFYLYIKPYDLILKKVSE